MKESHLWQGQWLDDDGLHARWRELSEDLARTLDGQGLPNDLVIEACGTLRDRLFRGKAKVTVPWSHMATDDRKRIGETLRTALDPARLEAKVRRELATPRPFVLERREYDLPIFEAWQPLGVMLHLTPANAPELGLLSVIEGLLAGNVNILKDSSRNDELSRSLLAALVDADGSGQIGQFVYALALPSSDQERLRQLAHLVDGVVVWGSDQTVRQVRDLVPPATRLIEWGHKISFAYLTPAVMTDQTILQGVAQDLIAMDQQACSCPQTLYVDTDKVAVAHELAHRLGQVLDPLSKACPQRPLGIHEAAEVTTVTQMARLESCLTGGEVVEGPRGDWRLLVDGNPGLSASPLHRTLWVKPLPRNQLTKVLFPVRGSLQTVGLGCTDHDYADLCQRLLRAGALRVTATGRMLESYDGEPHDGRYALQRYCRRVGVQPAPGRLSDVTSFAELNPAAAPRWGSRPGATPSNPPGSLPAIDDEQARLYLRSGGSSGQPKLSAYSYEDHDIQMRAGAEALLAAGFDPRQDRAMNLFFAGGLYGGFISYFSILERLNARHFPMGADADRREVAKTIVSLKVDTLLGMPSTILQLLRQQETLLRQYGGLRKIFYGGERFSLAQRAQLRSWGIEVIRSAVYGSNDAGVLGYQCRWCSDDVFHLSQQTQHLDILELDGDRPAEPGSFGRLLFTSRQRRAQQILAYDLGDTGRWVEGPCACGRQSPRFQLGRRQGDRFRVGTHLVSYAELVRLLTQELGYNDEVQCIVDSHASGDLLTMRLRGVDPALARRALLDRHKELHDASSQQGLLLEVEATNTFEYAQPSGKLRPLIDRRLGQACGQKGG
jgi:phenylacetate-coenzyme A ligase PaaK-like adenylate-forming protein